MRTANAVTQQQFDALLLWLDLDREKAGEKYEKIRTRLIRVFVGRGCTDAEDLADETINRVTHKLVQLVGNYSGDPIYYFYGVANKLHLEWLRKQKTIVNLKPPPPQNCEYDSPDLEYQCLEKCLDTLDKGKRDLIVEYYEGEKSRKIEKRKELGRRLGISESALQIKTFRIRVELRVCIEGCVGGRDS